MLLLIRARLSHGIGPRAAPNFWAAGATDGSAGTPCACCPVFGPLKTNAEPFRPPFIWPNGLFMSNNGYEFALSLLAISLSR